MKKTFIFIVSIILLVTALCTNSFAYTSVSNTDSNVYDTYDIDVGVKRTVVGRCTVAGNSNLSFLALALLGNIKNSTPNQKTIAVSIFDSKYTTHQYNITTNRAGYTNTKLSDLSTKNYTWQTVAKNSNTDSFFAGAKVYSNSVVSSVSVRTKTGSTQGYKATPSITVAS